MSCQCPEVHDGLSTVADGDHLRVASFEKLPSESCQNFLNLSGVSSV